MEDKKKRPYRGFTEAQKRANEKYISGNLEQIAIRVQKGKRQLYKNYADSRGESLAGMITRLIENEIEETGYTEQHNNIEETTTE